MKKSLTFIANWKMYLSYNQTVQLLAAHKDELTALAQTTGHTIVLCPMVAALSYAQTLCKGSALLIGGQTVSANHLGACTGEIDAQSLRELGCTFCIIGHSERRHYLHEANEQIALQALRLVEQNITPILCVGETLAEKQQHTTLNIIEQQVVPVLKKLQTTSSPVPRLVVAYEPVWAIGSNILPENNAIDQVFSVLAQVSKDFLPATSLQLLYGGSVDEQSIKNLCSLSSLDGFLIGRASLDFQKLQKIVTWSNNR